jgi:hypothetical protein
MALKISLKMLHAAFAETGRERIIFMAHGLMVDISFWQENGIHSLFFNRR